MKQENKKTKISRKMKLIISLELIFIITIFGFIFINSPKQNFPPSGYVIKEVNFSFDFQNADKLIIATNPEFDEAFVLENTRKIELPPGTYYWKVKDLFRESEIRNFTILSHVALSLDKLDEEQNETQKYLLNNDGNVDLNVTERQSGKTSPITSFVINVKESREVELNNTSYEGEQND